LKWGVLESFESLQLGRWPGYTENPIDDDRIPVRGLIGGEGGMGGKVQELTAVTGVVGVGEERGSGGISMANRGRRGAPRDDGGVSVAGVPKGSGEVAGKLPRGDVVLVVCLAGAKRRRSTGTAVRPSGGGA
jgi:hypothetical protein